MNVLYKMKWSRCSVWSETQMKPNQMKSNQWCFEFSRRFIEYTIIVGNIYRLCYGSNSRFTLIPWRWSISKATQFTLLLPLFVDGQKIWSLFSLQCHFWLIVALQFICLMKVQKKKSWSEKIRFYSLRNDEFSLIV